MLWLAVTVIVFCPGEKGFKRQLCFATKVENVVVTSMAFKEIKYLHSSAPLEWWPLLASVLRLQEYLANTHYSGWVFMLSFKVLSFGRFRTLRILAKGTSIITGYLRSKRVFLDSYIKMQLVTVVLGIIVSLWITVFPFSQLGLYQ